MRSRAYRRHQEKRHMRRRLKEDHNQHYDDLDCPCWCDPRSIARLKDQPKLCSCWRCGNPRRYHGEVPISERRFAITEAEGDY